MLVLLKYLCLKHSNQRIRIKIVTVLDAAKYKDKKLEVQVEHPCKIHFQRYNETWGMKNMTKIK